MPVKTCRNEFTAPDDGFTGDQKKPRPPCIRSYAHVKSGRNQQPGLFGLTLFGIAATNSPAPAAGADNVELDTVTVHASSAPAESTNSQRLDLGIYSGPVQDIPQAIDIIEKEQIQDQSITRLQDALRNVPGITMNSGEGGGHGDNVNLRGLVSNNAFYMDGMRDPGNYQRDSFNLESLDVIKGSSSMMFGYGSTAGLINQVSKLPTQAAVNAFSVKGGTNAMARMTGDSNYVINDGAAMRLAVMAERSNVTDRDYVLNRRFGFAPSIAFGMDGPTRLTLSFFHQEENNIPDYGIPFVNGAVAPAPRSNYYGLANYDHTQTGTSVATAVIEHAFNKDFKLSNTLRYGNYGFNYQVTAPTLDNDNNPLPSPGTPLSQIPVYRDQPSSSGVTTVLADRLNLNSAFSTGSLRHALSTGLTLSRETMNVTRYVNQNDSIPATSLLNPNPLQTLAITQQIADQPSSRGDDINFYAVDTVHVTDQWDVVGGLNFDRFISTFNEPYSASGFTQTNNLFSPRAALVFKPTAMQSYYFSYGTSYNPAIEYLSLAPGNTTLAPQKTTNLELGGKLSLLKGMLSLNGALFQIQADNVRVADPDDPTVQSVTFSERVRGLELTLSGRLTKDWSINAGYTHLIPEIVAGTDPSEVGKTVPNVSRDTVNLWTTYNLFQDWKVGSGLYYYGSRYASPDNSVGMSSYMLWNMMAVYQLSDHFNVQLNLDNVTNKYYLQSAYFSSASESHAVPGAGRTGFLTINAFF